MVPFAAGDYALPKEDHILALREDEPIIIAALRRHLVSAFMTSTSTRHRRNGSPLALLRLAIVEFGFWIRVFRFWST